MSKVAKMGKHSYGNVRVVSGKVQVGNFCSIAGGVTAVILNDHQVTWVTTYPFGRVWNMSNVDNPVVRQNPNIIIGNDVWIGQNAVLLEDTVIGDGVIIGSHSVVHGEIPPYAVAVGNPAKVVKKRFTDEQIESLLSIQWWNWEDEKVREFAPLLCSTDINEFIRKATNG